MVQRGWPEAAVRTTTFVALMAAVLLVLTLRRARHGASGRNPWLPRLLLGVSVVATLAIRR